MSSSPYDPPIAPVAHPASSGAKVWWFLVPVGYAILTSVWLLGQWWWFQPANAGSLNFSLDPLALRWIAKEALYQGCIVLVVTTLAISILPRIRVRHAVYLSLASVVGVYVVTFTAAYVRLPITTNGGQLSSIVASYAVVLWVSGIVIPGRDDKIAGHTQR